MIFSQNCILYCCLETTLLKDIDKQTKIYTKKKAIFVFAIQQTGLFKKIV